MMKLAEVIQGNAGVVFTAMALLGAILHWVKQAYRGEASWNVVSYWLADYPGNSVGFVGALAVAIWAVVGTDSLAGMQAAMVLASGFTLGWALDSGVNKGKRAVYTKAERAEVKQGGFARWQLLVLTASLSVAAACAQLGLPQAQTFNEKVAVSISTVTEARQTALTLLKAKKITPDDAQHIQDQANNVRAGIEVAVNLHKSNPTAGEAKLEATRAAIAALQAYLVARQ